MSYEQPSPPANLPTEIVDALNEATPEHLRDAASYAEALAEHKEREARLEEEADDTDVKERPDDLPGRRPSQSNDHDQGDQRQSVLLLAVAGRRFGDVEVQRAGESRRVDEMEL